ncbi:Quinol monooxygenase YgiN [Acetoanaerobium noterae]|uniref:Quinol monooxygenase YgiN n=1 Tax=Acetoanaerobium noterae TaxID=745369 RepID=A0A1T5CZ94_9FIRM|nr:putative quinol monooxygenase [Acetoanaerobium noterae]SKB64697.1 Quinol monooxygenase YgiN [Acetoanaerobium noterae]
MITVIAKNYIQENKVYYMLELCNQLIEETRKEKGCISYELFRNKDNINEFTFIEQWDSIESLKYHMESHHFEEIIPRIQSISYKQSEVELYDKYYFK